MNLLTESLESLKLRKWAFWWFNKNSRFRNIESEKKERGSSIASENKREDIKDNQNNGVKKTESYRSAKIITYLSTKEYKAAKPDYTSSDSSHNKSISSQENKENTKPTASPNKTENMNNNNQKEKKYFLRLIQDKILTEYQTKKI